MKTHAALLGLVVLFALAGCRGQDRARGATRVLWPELADYWFAEAGVVEDDSLGARIRALNGRVIEITGYMVPLDGNRRQSEFLLTSDAGEGCNFCVGGGPEGLIEVKPRDPVDFTYELVTLRGRLELLHDDPLGGMFRLHEATLAP